MIGVAIGTAALIVVLSVFNGLQDLIQSTFNSFDPQLKIEADLGKSFKMTPKIRSKIEAIEDRQCPNPLSRPTSGRQSERF
jgi:lipoprotein-releasing system permease protein